MADITITPPTTIKPAAKPAEKPAPPLPPTAAELSKSDQLAKWMPGLRKNLEKLGVKVEPVNDPANPAAKVDPAPAPVAPVTPVPPPEAAKDPVVPAAATPPPESTPEGKKRKVNKPPTGMSPEDVGRLAAEAAAAVVNRVNQPAHAPETKPPTVDPLEGLTESQRSELSITQELEQINPKKYQGLSERAPAYYRALNALESERDRKLAELKGDDAATDEVIRDYEAREDRLAKKHRCDNVEEIDRTRAAASLMTKPMQEQLRRLEAAEQERQRQAYIARIAPQITQSATSAADEVAEQLAGRKVKLDNGSVPDEEYVALEANDPAAANIIRQSTAMVRNVAATVHGAFAGVADQQAVNWTRDRILEAERNVLSMTPSRQREEDPEGDGRSFVTLDQWQQLTATQRAGCWTTNADYLVDTYKDGLVKSGKAEIERMVAARKAHTKAKPPTPKPVESPAMTTSIPAPTPAGSAPASPAKQLDKWYAGAAKKAATMKT